MPKKCQTSSERHNIFSYILLCRFRESQSAIVRGVRPSNSCAGAVGRFLNMRNYINCICVTVGVEKAKH